MPDDLSDEETREYMISFAKDKRIPNNTLFNIFQTALKLFNTAGGTSQLSVWNSPPGDALGMMAPSVVFGNEDMVCISY
jgi:hypothetical protein